jgi:hypothetical protein
MTTRHVTARIDAQVVSDGAGVRLRRSLGSAALDQLDPFLLLDEFRSDDPDDYIAGFPEHPHRGFETVTYMLAGSMEHRDHTGRRGLLQAGGVQWMTAGRGIVHSEMPRQEAGLMWGFQLWINLPAAEKRSAPRYQEFGPQALPQVALPGGGLLRAIAGRHGGVDGAVVGVVTDPTYLDVTLPAGLAFEQALPAPHNACAYVFEGSVRFPGPGGTTTMVAAGQLAVLADGTQVSAVATDAGARFLLLAARPLGEPVARHGPFVMNTRAELLEALDDLRTGRFTS